MTTQQWPDPLDPTPPTAEGLPIVAWLHELTTESYRESSITSFSETDPWVDALKDIGHAVLSRPLTPHAPAQAQIDVLRIENERLSRELEEAKIKAERYRWLRDSESIVWPSVDLANACYRAAQTGNNGLIDSFVDAAMATKEAR